ncbi:MAG TPA: hypothetical protein VEU33_30650 [Archangium sp.]|nr:hypothetical protein [Archangium sp.]
MASKRKSSTKNEGAPTPALLAKAEDVLRRLGNPDFDFDDMYRSREDEIAHLRALRFDIDDFDASHRYFEAEHERLLSGLVRSLDDPQFRMAVDCVERLQRHVETLREYAGALAKSVAATALLEDERAGRHHIAELLRGPLSEEALRNLCREVPSPPDLATAIYTGLRKGELLALRKADVDLCNRLLTVARSWERDTTKGGHAEVIPIAAELVPYLEEAPPPSWFSPMATGACGDGMWSLKT